MPEQAGDHHQEEGPTTSQESPHLEHLFNKLGLRKNGGLDDEAAPTNPIHHWLIGAFFIIASLSFLSVTTYTIIIAKLLPETGYPVLDFFRTDQYFCYLFPLTIVPFVVSSYLKWVAMQFYKHN